LFERGTEGDRIFALGENAHFITQGTDRWPIAQDILSRLADA